MNSLTESNYWNQINQLSDKVIKEWLEKSIPIQEIIGENMDGLNQFVGEIDTIEFSNSKVYRQEWKGVLLDYSMLEITFQDIINKISYELARSDLQSVIYEKLEERNLEPTGEGTARVINKNRSGLS